jgi:hypothetical protein
MTPALSAHEPGKRKSTVDFQVAGMKRDLAQWLGQKCGAKHSTAIQMALLEVALDDISPNARRTWPTFRRSPPTPPT